MSLFIARGFCALCQKFVEFLSGSSVVAAEEMAQHDHFVEFKHFFDGVFETAEQKQTKKAVAPREPKGDIKPLKKRKHERF